MKFRERINRRLHFDYYYLLVIAFRILLDLSYEKIVSINYGYMGFLNHESSITFIISWLLLLILMIIGKVNYENRDDKLSKEIIFWLFLISYIPFTSMVRFGTFPKAFVAWNTVYWIFLMFSGRQFKIKRQISVRGLWKPVVNDEHIKLITIISLLVVLYVSGRYAGFRINLNLLNVYDFRNEARGYNLPLLLDYAFAWTRTVNSILEAYFIRKRKWGWALACFVIQILNFGVDGSKTTLFLALFAIVINFMPKFELKNINKWILMGFIGIISLCFMAYIILGDIIPASIITRRVFFIPAYMQNNYFDFFTHNTPDYFRQSFLRYFGFRSPYPRIAYMIGEVYSNQSSMSANNGLISDAVTNMGYPGIFIMPFVLRWFLKLLDKAAEGLDVRLYITVALYTSLMLTNSFLFTVLLTHGLLVVMLLLKSMNRKIE